MFKNPLLVSHQEIIWQDGMPYSKIFNDRYFQKNALDEIENVFIEPNNLREKFTKHNYILVGELGFGLGINFLYSLKIWIESKKLPFSHFDFVSIEKYLPTPAQVSKAASLFPELNDVTKLFLEYYQPVHNGLIKINFKELRASLILINADVIDAFDYLKTNHSKIDAWFLDGFDPKQNPEMWTSEIVAEIKKSSKINASFGTYTASGLVKKSFLENDIGFQRVAGFNKRHKLIGRINSGQSISNSRGSKRVAIIGSGIAAAGAVHALKKFDLKCDVFEQSSQLHSGASGNDAAALYPKFQLNNSPLNRFLVQSYFYAYQEMLQFQNSFFPAKAWFFGVNERTKQWINAVNSNQDFTLFSAINNEMDDALKEYAAINSEFLLGAYLKPRNLIEEIFANSNIEIRFNHELVNIEQQSDCSKLFFSNGFSSNYDFVILAMGTGLSNWISDLQISKGHIIGVPERFVSQIQYPIHHRGYVLPTIGNYVWMGSTYEHEYFDLTPSKEQILAILEDQKVFIKDDDIPMEEIIVRASERVSRKNKFPIAGKLKSKGNVFAIGALGSRGFSSSFLCGDVIANQIMDGFIPLDYEVMDHLNC